METTQISLFDGTQNFKIDKPIRLIELFGGIGSQAKALENLGVNFEHYRLCEFDKYAVASYNAVHGTNFATSDITKINATDLGIVDTDKYEYIMTYSFPCQDLSNAGLGKGMDKGSGTRSGLLWEVERLLNECTELPQVLVMENVSQVHAQKNIENFSKWINVLEKKGYKCYWEDLNAKNYGIPQNRERCFMISILDDYFYTFPRPMELHIHLKDLLEEEVDEKFYLSDKNLTYVLDCNRVCDNTLRGDIGDRVVNPHIAKTISCRGAASQRADITNFVVEGTDKEFTINEMRDKIKERRLTTDIRLKQVGILSGGKWDKVHDSNKRVYDDGGLAPTITTCGGGHTEPKILVKNSAKKGQTQSIAITDHESPIVYDEQNNKLHADGVCNTIVCDGSSPGHNPRIIEPKERFFKQAIETANTNEIKDGDVIDAYNKKVNDTGISPTLTTRSEGSKTAILPIQGYRIRKLTPKECWRLMGFSDTDFDNAAKYNSNSQLYKQAGNSIVVNVLMAIFSQML